MDLNTDTSLMVDISDALSERDRVKFTVHTKVRKLGLIFTIELPCHSLVIFNRNEMCFFLVNAAEFQGERVFRGQGTRGVCLASRSLRRK